MNPLEALRKKRRHLVGRGKETIGSHPVIRGNPAGGMLRHLLPVHILNRAAVEPLEQELRTTTRCRRKTHIIALIRGAADGSTAKAGARSHPGQNIGSPDQENGTADIKQNSQERETKREASVLSAPPPGLTKVMAMQEMGVSFVRLSKVDRGGISLSAPL